MNKLCVASNTDSFAQQSRLKKKVRNIKYKRKRKVSTTFQGERKLDAVSHHNCDDFPPASIEV
jgi:hypothetical protein